MAGKSRFSISGALAALAMSATSASAGTVTFFVSGQADIFLAGLGAPLSLPGGAGLLPPSIAVLGGQTLSISATGIVSCCSGSNPNGPNGQATSGTILGVGNVGDFVGNGLALTGVYLGASPTGTPFQIGSGGTFVVPTGATALYFGIPDAASYGSSAGFYSDNTGGFTVTVSSAVPEPATWAMMLIGFAGLAMAARRKQAAA
jgi:hypothetical protein